MAIASFIIIGLIVNWLLGYATKYIQDHGTKSIKLLPPSKETEDKWATLTSGNEGGAPLGFLERLLFFGAFWGDAPLVVAAWLTFKVASKWNAWSNVISVPEKFEGLDGLDYLIARRRWGSHVLVSFLIGTLTNVIFGYLAVILICNIYPVFK